jgi:hypothetical protein
METHQRQRGMSRRNMLIAGGTAVGSAVLADCRSASGAAAAGPRTAGTAPAEDIIAALPKSRTRSGAR